MEKVWPHGRMELLKGTAIVVAAMIIVSSAAMVEVMVATSSETNASRNTVRPTYQSHSCEVSSIPAQEGLWIAFDSSAPGTQAEDHVTISDTSGITIVADFHGFWRNNYTANATVYDDILMPGTGSMQEPGTPLLPCLFEYLEIPHNIDISIDILASSKADLSGYNIRPAIVDIPFAGTVGQNSSFYALPIFFGPAYSSNEFFPGNITSTQGETNGTAWIMRGHRLLGLSIYPIQYNPITGNLVVYSQIIIKVRYSIPAQIEPIPVRLISTAFELILSTIILNYGVCDYLNTRQTGVNTINTPQVPGTEGAEYLIITTQDFEYQANKLAEWKEQKGVRSEIRTVDKGSGEQVKEIVRTAYRTWDPVPAYVLLMGDVEFIPADYSFQHRGHLSLTPPFPFFEQSYLWTLLTMIRVGDKGYIASDLGYFTVAGGDYLPEMIYGRISVDTEDQAGTIVDKILQYEKNPTENTTFYDNVFLAGELQDRYPTDGQEDPDYPFLSTIERIRHYLKEKYTININYSCFYLHYDRPADGYFSLKNLGINLDDLKFAIPIEGSYFVSESISSDYPNFGWLYSYSPPEFSALARANITPNINQGRFLVLFSGHGGSKNMMYPYDNSNPADGHDRNDRDATDGWQFPYFDTSYFSDLTNGYMTPLIISIACDTGWYDGETDQEKLVVTMNDGNPANPFEEYAVECFAENITRLDGGGAIAAISPSRPAPAIISAHLTDGLIQAFWPGFVESSNQPFYGMGEALLQAKLYAVRKIPYDYVFDTPRTIFEEYHLFGDPETELWTKAPLILNVSYPKSIGTSDPQNFVVTVRDNITMEPIPFAKVCIQQNQDIYQVGYTDPAGQVIFSINPADTPSVLNVTVTKHNYRPYIGEIQIKHTNAEVTVSPYVGSSIDDISIQVSGFDDLYPVDIYFDDQLKANVPAGLRYTSGNVPDGPNGYVNVWALQGDIAAVTLFYRLSTSQGPDPYIYSQNNPNTWQLASGERVWDNPCISVYYNGNPAATINQGSEYDVNVTVFNRANVAAADTKVTLSYAPFGGGVSWTEIGSDYITVDPLGSAEVTIRWRLSLSSAACLKVDLYNENESLEDRIDNSGEESLNIIPLCSPGSSSFVVGNPTDETNYVFIRVKQKGNYRNVWNACIIDYSSQILLSGASETVTFLVDPGVHTQFAYSSLFTIEIHVNCELVGGMDFIATLVICPSTCCCTCLLIFGAILVVGAIAYHKRKAWEVNRRNIILPLVIIVILFVFLLNCIGIIDILPVFG